MALPPFVIADDELRALGVGSNVDGGVTPFGLDARSIRGGSSGTIGAEPRD